METRLQRAAHLLDVPHLVVFTGAGMSKDSGLDTFRDADGVWSRNAPEDYASPEGFRRNPRAVWRWYLERREQILAAEPNAGHKAVAALEQLLPRVTVITQNIDGLHQRAGSRRVLELHGSVHRYKCSKNCRGVPTLTPTPELDQTEPLPCPYCGALTRPDVVWFGELLPAEVWEAAIREISACEAVLVIGTSGQVEPAASLVWRARDRGKSLVEINPAPTLINGIAEVVLPGTAAEMTPALLAALVALHAAD
ncbi:MAG TPA: NAD-dependent deacylase [Anaerolineae bacterium]|nr:MAG: NAD-dependent protein deacylase [Chloroflexi bacterium ADurb.Bin222]HOC22626.1 NAD-dependent deacylase [Anaerolineae bacterium]